MVSLIAVTAMLAVYSLSLPEFLVSPLGRAFAVVWAAMAIIIFVAHARRLSERPRPLPALYRSYARGRLPHKEAQRAVRPLRG